MLKNSFALVNLQGIRCLFSPENLGYEGYKRQKAIVTEQVGNARERFFERLDSYIGESENNSVFSEDLKASIYLAESDKEIGLVDTMIRRYHTSNIGLKISSFIFGPVALRLLHVQNKPDIAISLFKDPSMDGFFDQMSSFMIYMDLLYKNQKYVECLEAMDKMIEKSMGGIKFSMDCLTLAAASCYKLNKPELVQKVVGYLHQAKELDYPISMRTIVYSAMLASNQKNHAQALQILSMINSEQEARSPVSYLNVKIHVLTELDRFEDAVGLLTMIVQTDEPFGNKRDIFEEVLRKLTDKLKETKNLTLLAKAEKIEKSLKSCGRLMAFPFVEYLDSEIQNTRSLNAGYKSRERSSIVRKHSNDPSAKRTLKPGIITNN